MNEEQITRAYEQARKKVAEGISPAAGGAGHEVSYAEAYQNLVKAGLAPQLPRKYRHR